MYIREAIQKWCAGMGPEDAHQLWTQLNQQRQDIENRIEFAKGQHLAPHVSVEQMREAFLTQLEGELKDVDGWMDEIQQKTRS
jgi:hypothetical protein